MAPSWLNKAFDREFYDAKYECSDRNVRPEWHYLTRGAIAGFYPRADFDPLVYSCFHTTAFPAVALAHALVRGDWKGYQIEDIIEILPAKVRKYAKSNINREQVRLSADSELDTSALQLKNFSEGYSRGMDADSHKAKYWIEAPSSRKFLDLMESGDPFCYVKLPHSFWNRFVFVKRLSLRLKEWSRARSLSSEHLTVLAARLSGYFNPGRQTGLLLGEGFFDEVFGILRGAVLRETVKVGLAFDGGASLEGRETTDIFQTESSRADVIRSIVPEGYKFWDGTLMKRLAISGALSKLPELIKNRPTLLIMSDAFDGLADEWGISNYKHLRIARENSHLVRHKLLRDATIAVKQLYTGGTPPIVLAQAGGSLTFWLLCQLQERFPDASFLDTGQAINIWRTHSDLVHFPWLRDYKTEIIANNPNISISIPDA